MAEKIPKSAVLGFWLALMILIASIIGVTWLLRTQDFSPPVRIALALTPPVIWAFCLIFLLRSIRLLDELQQRIHLEALAIAFPSVAVAIFACEYLRKAGFIPYLMPDHVLMIMMGVLLIGYLIAWRRYL